MTTTRPTPDSQSDDVREPTHVVLGGCPLAYEITKRLRADGHAAVVVREGHDDPSVPGVDGQPTDAAALAAAGAETATTVIAATRSDRRNLMAAQLARARFGVPRTVVLVNDPRRREALTAAGHESICVAAALSDSVAEVA